MNPPNPKACPHCGSPLATIIFNNTDYISGETFSIAKCSQCGVGWTVLPETFSNLSKYYGQSYYGKKGSRFLAPMEALVRFFRMQRVNQMTREFSAPGAALDIGCGRALTLALLKQKGWQCAGTEFEPELAQAAMDAYNIPVRAQPTLAECKFDEASFDLISMYHVLEHVQNPFQTLGEIRRILKPNGRFFVEVPNLDSLQAQTGQGKWFHLDSPRHLWHFGSASLAQLLTENGFEIISSSTHSLEYGYYGFWQTLLNLFTQKMNVAYALLKKHPASAQDTLISILAALPAAIIGIPGEALACMARKGGVIQMVARPITHASSG